MGEKCYKKDYDIIFNSLAINGKLDEIMESAKDKARNPFLMLPHGNVFSTAYTHQCLAKNHPVLLKMYEAYLELPQSNDNYIQAKIKQKHNNQLKSMLMREKVDILIYVTMSFFGRGQSITKSTLIIELM